MEWPDFYIFQDFEMSHFETSDIKYSQKTFRNTDQTLKTELILELQKRARCISIGRCKSVTRLVGPLFQSTVNLFHKGQLQTSAKSVIVRKTLSARLTLQAQFVTIYDCMNF